MDTVLVKEYRADIVECVHNGHICIVNDEGAVQAYAGDPEYVAFTRSSAKPLQAIPSIRSGLADHYGLTVEEIAIMTASHRAEPAHVEVLERFARKVSIGESNMVCASSWPLDEGSKESLLREGSDKSKWYHNCSGKHYGMLAYCQMAGYPLKGYDHPEHPLQQEILGTVSDLAGLAPGDIRLGTDGCGLPVFAMPLRALATAYMKLASPDRIEDEPTRKAVLTITSAMNASPYMVAGNHKVDTLLLEDDNVVAKGGFKGVYCFGLKKERLGISFKIADGSEEEWGWIVESILEQIGYSNKTTLQRLKAAYPKDLFNDEGRRVGRAETEFILTRV
ncbi:asparaginase [Paenibacillus glucanolyticus]|uniref:asparaginase n=2 Tax=Paenibacillus glucanolyticus TaxID=59843 RepID=UPI0030C92074